MTTNRFRHISRGAIVSFLGSIVGKLSTFISTIIITNLVGAGAFGSLSIGLSILTLLLLFSTSGITDGVIRDIGRGNSKREKARSYFTGILIVTVSSVPFGLIMWLYSGQIASTVFDSTSVSPYIRYFGLVLPVAATGTVSIAATRGWNQSLPTNVTHKVIFPISKLVLIGTAIWYGGSDQSIAVAIALSYVVLSVVGFGFVYPILLDHLSEVELHMVLPTRETITSMIKFALPLLLSSGAWIILNRSDTLILGYYRSEKIVGYYSAAFSLATFFQIINRAAGTLFMNNISALYEERNYEEIKRIYQKTTKWIIVLSVPLAISILGFPDRILEIYGKDFSSAVLPLQILSVGVLLQLFVGLNGDTIKSFGDTKWYMIIQVLSLIINIMMNILLIPRFNMVGAAVATSTAYVFSNSAHTAYLYFEYSIPPGRANHISYSVVFIIISTTIAGWDRLNSLSRIVVYIFTLSSMYLFIVYILGIIDRDEINTILSEFI